MSGRGRGRGRGRAVKAPVGAPEPELVAAAGGQLLPPGHYYIVLDFEATCSQSKGWVNEIIEFPSVVVDMQGQARCWGDRVKIVVHPCFHWLVVRN